MPDSTINSTFAESFDSARLGSTRVNCDRLDRLGRYTEGEGSRGGGTPEGSSGGAKGDGAFDNTGSGGSCWKRCMTDHPPTTLFDDDHTRSLSVTRLSLRGGTTRRSTSAEILSTAAQLSDKRNQLSRNRSSHTTCSSKPAAAAAHVRISTLHQSPATVFIIV